MKIKLEFVGFTGFTGFYGAYVLVKNPNCEYQNRLFKPWKGKSSFRRPLLLAGVMFSEYHANTKTTNNEGLLLWPLIVHIAIKRGFLFLYCLCLHFQLLWLLQGKRCKQKVKLKLNNKHLFKLNPFRWNEQQDVNLPGLPFGLFWNSFLEIKWFGHLVFFGLFQSWRK